MRKLILISALMISGCGMAPDRAKCDAQYASMASRGAAFTVGSTTKAAVRSAIGSPVTDYQIVEYTGTVLGSQLGYRLYENGNENSSSCGFYYFTFNTSEVLANVTKNINSTPASTKTHTALEPWTQY